MTTQSTLSMAGFKSGVLARDQAPAGFVCYRFVQPYTPNNPLDCLDIRAERHAIREALIMSGQLP
jgi:hypothetical protein